MANFGIIGLGVISEIHAKAIEAVNGAKLIGGFSPISSQVEEFSRRWGCKGFYSLEDLLAESGVDAVAICSPSGAHLEPALKAARAGKHLVIEKPIEINSTRAARIVESAEKHGVMVSGIFQSRFYEAATHVKQALDRGRFGRVSFVDAYVKWFRTQEYYSASGWRGTWEMDGGGALMNQSIHMVDMLQWLMGPPKEIYCRMDTLGHDGIEVEDTAAVTMQFTGGAFGVLEGTTSAYPGFYKRFEVSGTSGSAVIEEDRIVVWDFEKESSFDDELREKYGVGTYSRSNVPRYESDHSAHARQYQNIIAAIEGRGPLAVNGRDAIDPIKLIECAYTSARKNRPFPFRV